VRARRVIEVVPDGSTEPLRVRGEDGADWIVKPGGAFPDAPNELLAALLAPAWGVRVPEPAIVTFSEAICLSMEAVDGRGAGRPHEGPLAKAARRIKVAGGSAYGGRLIQGRLVQGASDIEQAGLSTEAMRVRAFDAFLGNTDRTEDNTNLLFHEEEDREALFAIDHAAGLGWLWVERAVEAPAVELGGDPHVAAQWPMPPAPPVDWEAIEAAVASLPPAWRRGRESDVLVERIGARWEACREGGRR
jgi:hypothetical protein